MLIQFAVENYRSFRDRCVLSLRASGDVAPDAALFAHIAEVGPVARAVALYGANASGKSNLLRAMVAGARTAVRGTTAADSPLPQQPFKLALEAGRASVVEYVYAVGDKVLTYELVTQAGAVLAERLTQNLGGAEIPLFDRKAPDSNGTASIAFGPALHHGQDRAAFLEFVAAGTRPNQPLVAEALARNVHELRWATDWLRGLADSMPGQFGRDLGSDAEQHLARSLEDVGQRRTFVEQVVSRADAGIVGVAIERGPLAGTSLQIRSAETRVRYLQGRSTDVKQQAALFAAQSAAFATDRDPVRAAKGAADAAAQAAASAAHAQSLDRELSDANRALAAAVDSARTLRFDHAPSGTATFALDDESEGTVQLLTLANRLYDARKTHVPLLVDELESSLHPHLARHLLGLFREGDRGGRSQIIFTTHSPDLLDDSLVPIDGTWFVEKDAGGASHLHSLADFDAGQLERLKGQLRQGYLVGRFGGIPLLGDPAELVAADAVPRGAP